MEGVAILLLVGAFVVARVLKQAGEAMRNGQLPRPPRAPGDAPQTMTELLAEMREQMELARRQQAGRPARPGETVLPQGSARAVEAKRRLALARGASLPVPVERGGSIEVAGREEALPTVDRDDEAEAVVQRRIAAAELRNAERRPADHEQFDERIRVAPPRVASARSRPSLRQAMIWREVLSLPLALRDRDEG